MESALCTRFIFIVDRYRAESAQLVEESELRNTSAALLAMSSVMLTAQAAFAASSAGCIGGGFSLLGLSGDQRTIVAASKVDAAFLVKGRYVEFTVDSATLAVRDWTLTGAPNDLDITNGRRTVVFASKIPDHRGLALTGDLSVRIARESLVISRAGEGLSMKIQVKDCANGGVFQMEPLRADATGTVFTHVLGDGVFYFDNPNVRDRLGERIPCSGVMPDGSLVSCQGANPDGTVTVTPRVNFANDWSSKFVGRDSSQVATRIATGCTNDIPNPFHPGTVNHCGGISQWSVASGGDYFLTGGFWSRASSCSALSSFACKSAVCVLASASCVCSWTSAVLPCVRSAWRLAIKSSISPARAPGMLLRL